MQTTILFSGFSNSIADPYLLDRQKGQRFLVRSSVHIGRDHHNQICLEGTSISLRHAKIEKMGDIMILKDLRSEAGTFLNGTRIYEAPLNQGDHLQIGEYHFDFISQLSPAHSSISSKNLIWQKRLNDLPAMAKSSFPILLKGPSGSGKDRIAYQIHQISQRSNYPFFPVNCASLSEHLIESELFGHIKGSYTGAHSDRKGAFESARFGTLFLDEIAELPLTLQAKLLRAIENSEIKQLGSDKIIKSDVRIISATHQNLEEKVRAGQFRQDLFYRLNVLSIEAPALKDRLEDFEDLILELSEGKWVRFSDPAKIFLKSHSWPGNIRELRNVISRAVAIYGSRCIDLDGAKELVSLNPSSEESQNSKKQNVISEVQKHLILEKLKENHGNQRLTAFELGLPKSTLNDKLRNWGIDATKFKI